jgi:hypothetical protein
MRIQATRKLAASVTAAALVLTAGAVAANATSDGPNTTRARYRTPDVHRRISAPISDSVGIQAIYDEAGNPDLTANFLPDGSLAKPSWSICPPPDVNVCTPARSKSQFLQAGPTPAGTVFQASATYRGHTYIARTVPWQGTVQATSPPRLDGSPRYHAAVRPEGASWAGGWGSDFDFLSVEACRTTDATRCVNLSAAKGYGFSSRPPIVGAWFTGWYLFAFDQRLAHDTAFAEPGYSTAAAIPPVKAGPTVGRSGPVGPIIGPTPPRIRILRNASTATGKILVARIRCSVPCHVFLQVDDNRTGSDARVALTGSALVGVPRKQLRRGPLRVTLYVDTGPFINGKTRLR